VRARWPRLASRRIDDSATIASVRRRTLILLALSSATCSSPRQTAEHEWIPVASADLGAVVARVGQVPIFAKQVEAEAKRTGNNAQAALEDLIAGNLLAERARQRGFIPASHADHDVQAALVQRLLEKELEPALRLEAIPDTAILPLYEKARDAFVHARLVFLPSTPAPRCRSRIASHANKRAENLPST
jgi:hypothetical protein